MRRLSLLFAALFVVPLCGSDSPKEYDDKTEVVGIEGTWRLIELEMVLGFRGKQIPSLNGRNEACKYIYQIDGDTLRIAGFYLIFDGEEMRWPQGFNGENVTVETYKPTGHAKDGSARYIGFSRMSRLLSWGRSASPIERI